MPNRARQAERTGKLKRLISALRVIELGTTGKWIILSAAIGIAAGLGGICFQVSVQFIQRYAMGELAGVQIVAVPTLDWAAVKDAHFQGSIHRAIESRYVIVRAAINGISAVVSARGEVIAEMDHVENGAGYVVAEIAFN